MKTSMKTLLTIGTALLLTTSAGAQMMGSGPDMMREQARQSERYSQDQSDRPYMDYRGIPNCYGMGPGMMGGYGMGPGMMRGYGMGPGMMGGYGMGPGMMRGYGMGPGMMGGYGMMHGYGMGHMNRHMMDEHGWGHGITPYQSNEEYDKYLDATKDMRKKLHDMRFEYREMMRDSKTTVGDLEKMREEMFKLQQEIYEQSEK